MIRVALIALAAPLALAACTTTAADLAADAAAARGDMTPNNAGAYVEMAAASDLFEIQSGTLATQRGQSAAVRQFGQTLVSHHNQTTAQLTAAATAAGIPPTPDLMPAQAQMMEQLRTASDADFDRVFQQLQIQAHETALALHSNYAASGDIASLRATAAAAAPIVEQHLVTARALLPG